MDFSIATAGLDQLDHSAQSFAAEPAAGPEPAPGPIALHVEWASAQQMIGHHAAWQDLCDRALERNIFLEPAFALPLVQHAVSGRPPDFVLVWEENGPASFGRLLGLLPILAPNALVPAVVHGFRHPQVRLGTPLIDRARGAEALDALLDWLVVSMPSAAALRLTGLDVDGRFNALLVARCAAVGRVLSYVEGHRRAVLTPTPDRARKVMPFTHTKRRKEIGRQRRRLSEQGAREYTSATTPDEIARAAERFLALEHNGWKGQRGTALLAAPTLTTFTRTMTRMMAHEGKCRIDSIEIDGKAVAMGIVLTVDRRAHFWKTAFDETYARLSPGVQFALELTERQLADDNIAITDSCAVPDHPMIDRLWGDRMNVTDVLVELDPRSPLRFARARRREHQVRAMRACLKRVYVRLRRTKAAG